MENRTGRNESHKKELPKELLKESSQKYNLPDSLLEEVREILVSSMENALTLPVPFLVEAKTGNNWEEAH